MNEALVIRNAFLIDGTGAAPKADATVVVADGVIKEIGWQLAKAPAAAVVIDLKGKCLLPGLIDAHTHAGNIELKPR